MFKEWKTLRGLGQSFGFSVESMENLKRYEGFPVCKCEKSNVLYNYYEFRDWLQKYEAGEVREIPPATVTAAEMKLREEASGPKYFLNGKWIKG